MDPAIVPLVLVALIVAMGSTWHELRASLRPAVCRECPHCQRILLEQRQAALDDARRQADLRSWYARQHGLDDRDDEPRR